MRLLVRAALILAALAAARAAADLGRRGAAQAGGLWSASLAAYNRKDNPAALSAVRRLLADDPDNPLYRRHEAAVLFALGDSAGAAAAAERFLRTAPDPVEACALIANAYRKLEDRPRFLDALRRCLEFDPRGAESAFNYAQGLEEAGKLEAAAGLYAVLADGGYLGALISLGRVRLRQGRTAESERLARSALTREPGNPAALILAGQAAAAQGQHRRALRDLEAARLSAPLHPEVWRSLAGVRAALGDQTGARRAADELRRLSPAREVR